MSDTEQASIAVLPSTSLRVQRLTRLWHGFAVTMTILGICFGWQHSVAGELELLSEEESRQFGFRDDEVLELPGFIGSMRLRGITAGPDIILLSPEPGEELIKNRPLVRSTSPLSLHLEIQSVSAPVDMGTLSVKIIKFGLSKDITSLLRDYITGTSIQATGLQVRKGKYQIAVDVADTGGLRSRAEYILKVMQ